MNNDEKKILDGQKKSEAQSPAADAPKETKTQSKSFASGWKNLGGGIKAAIIAGVALVVIVPILLAVLLSGNGGPDGDDDDEGGSGNINQSYSVTVVTKGGMVMSELPVYIYEYGDGVLGDMIEGAFAATDANGKATFSLPAGGRYAAKIDISMPDGYDVASHYPLVSSDMTITVSSSVIPETSLVGVSYTLGAVMRDFTVTTTEGKKFTLSEALKEKDAVLINFWYTTCSWCITEFPFMQAVYENYSDDIAIIALDPYTDPQTGDTLDEIKLFKSDMGLTFDMAQDFSGLANAFGVTGYPTSVMVDRYGVITLIEPGAITSERAFDLMFDHFTGDDYKQELIYNVNDLVPQEKPNVDMPSSNEMSGAFDKGAIEDIKYSADEDDEYSWPFIIDTVGEGDEAVECIKPSNSFKESSYAQLIIDVPLKAGDVLAFDYFSSTERGVDVLYVVVDGKDIYSISGESDSWETCFAFVAEEDATYEVGLAYTKDSGDNVGDDTVYLKDLRVVGIEDIDRETYIYRFAATNPDLYSEYQDYADIYFNENDGYYHVDSATGPILLADLMGYTRFSDDDYVYNMSLGKDYEAALTQYCNYASNAQLYGLCPVTEELKGLLIEISKDYGDPENDKDWLKLCCYYDAYGTDGKQLEDPIKGLALFAAYDVILSDKGDTDFPNSVTYNRVIMPRGLFSKFTPAESGTYLITSNAPDASNPGAFLETDGWIFTAQGFEERNAWYTYESVDRLNLGTMSDINNCYMIVYLEEGKDYYINVAYSDVYQEGTIDFRVERLGGEGYYRFSIASPGYFTSLESITGELTETIAGGIDVELGADGIWREKRTDGRTGSILYADFTKATPAFSHSIEQMIDLGAFNLSTTEGDEYIKAMLVSESVYEYYLRLYLADIWGAEYDSKYEEYKVDEVLDGIYHGEKDGEGNATKSENDELILGYFDSMATNTDYNNAENFKAFLKDYWGDDYAELLETYRVDDVLNGTYHGRGEDYTDLARSFLAKKIVAGYNADLDEIIAEDDVRIGCVIVTDELADLLQILMDKYTFEGIENSWTKVCYYTQYFCAATPK